jgi:hypothetical protein
MRCRESSSRCLARLRSGPLVTTGLVQLAAGAGQPCCTVVHSGCNEVGLGAPLVRPYRSELRRLSRASRDRRPVGRILNAAPPCSKLFLT